MRTHGAWPIVGLLVAALVSCGGDDDAAVDDTSVTTDTAVTTTTELTVATTTTVAPTTPATTTSTVAPTTTAITTSTTVGPATTVATTTEPAATTTTTTEPVASEPLAIWPAADVVFDTPELAAADFVSEALGVPPLLGEFQPGDGRSGEIVVFSPTDDDDPATMFPRGLLALRQLGAGWFVIAASSDGVSITSPDPMAVVDAGSVVMEGLGRGFEATVEVQAFLAGDATAVLDSGFTMTDWTTPLPYAVTFDLSGATPGDVVVLLARGATGLETDPSEFAAVPVMVAG